jgi:hypothetical protein
MDLSKYQGAAKKFEDGIWIDIKDPYGNDTDMKVLVASYQSERVQKVRRQIGNKAIREQRRNPKKAGTVEELERATDDVVVACVVDWKGFEMNGEALPCTPENVRSVVVNPDLWFIVEQIDKSAEDQQSFLTA